MEGYKIGVGIFDNFEAKGFGQVNAFLAEERFGLGEQAFLEGRILAGSGGQGSEGLVDFVFIDEGVGHDSKILANGAGFT